MKPAAKTVDWAAGSASWKQATQLHDEEDLWSQPNFCDSRVLTSSAPLTVLFGISTFWDLVKGQRGSLHTGRPLEVHVLGAAYPFEGRSDWSLLSSRRPPEIPAVRVVLVLGTPWQEDNVPHMEAKESEASMLQGGQEVVVPDTGNVQDGMISCSEDTNQTKKDVSFTKADYCRDHGNGLEVVCIEKYYQDVSTELPKPDAVVMFSPGFPQIARRSWDSVLRSLLASEVPIMVGDLASGNSMAEVFPVGEGKAATVPGDKWPKENMRQSEGEGAITLMAMRAYGARRVGAFRNPFPIFIPQKPDDTIIAKNAVLQVFSGRLADAKPLEMPSPAEIEDRKKKVAGLNLRRYFKDKDSAQEIKAAMLIPTSKAFDMAMWQMYKADIQQFVQHSMRRHRKNKTWISKVTEMGLVDKPRETPWTLDEWIFVLTKLKYGDQFL
jgi:hypothetical protein